MIVLLFFSSSILGIKSVQISTCSHSVDRSYSSLSILTLTRRSHIISLLKIYSHAYPPFTDLTPQCLFSRSVHRSHASGLLSSLHAVHWLSHSAGSILTFTHLSQIISRLSVNSDAQIAYTVYLTPKSLFSSSQTFTLIISRLSVWSTLKLSI